MLLLYLQNVPSHEKQIIFGCHWFKVEWKPSKQLVCASDDNCLMSFTILVFDKMAFDLSNAVVPAKIN